MTELKHGQARLEGLMERLEERMSRLEGLMDGPGVQDRPCSGGPGWYSEGMG